MTDGLPHGHGCPGSFCKADVGCYDRNCQIGLDESGYVLCCTCEHEAMYGSEEEGNGVIEIPDPEDT